MPERDEGIDAGNASCGNVAGSGENDEQEARDRQDCSWIYRRQRAERRPQHPRQCQHADQVQGIARAIQSQSDDVLIVEHGSLYPALQRLEDRGFVSAEWGVSDSNRRARFYTLTKTGRAELTREQSEWRKVAAAIMRVLEVWESLLFGVRPLDAGTFVAVASIFVSVAALASYVPARKAAKVDPLIALRCE